MKRGGEERGEEHRTKDKGKVEEGRVRPVLH